MQNRYTGDIGDYSKLGLLRALLPCNIPIGINWYLVPDETHNSDGRHVKYLERDVFRQCDEELWRELGEVGHNGERNVRSLQSENILPAVHYSAVLDFSGKKRNEREEIRRTWHRRAMKQLSGAGIICTDPDNGLIVPSARGTVRENKFIMPDEIRDYYLHGSSVIYYQHKARKLDKFYVSQHQKKPLGLPDERNHGQLRHRHLLYDFCFKIAVGDGHLRFFPAQSGENLFDLCTERLLFLALACQVHLFERYFGTFRIYQSGNHTF